MKKVRILLLLAVLFLECCSDSDIPPEYSNLVDSAISKAGSNKTEIQKALNEVPTEQKEGMAFLLAYMPEVDLKTIKAEILLSNCEYAYKARNEFSWCKTLPDSVFLNEVLPYRNLNEKTDDWRPDFYYRFKKYVKNCTNITEAIMAINANIKNEINVEYNTKRWKADQSPYESMKQGMASCTGLAILLVDALRSVGIPARVAGIPLWYDMSGNHNWTEVFVDGKWHFIEYNSTSPLDVSWFVAKAGKANANARERSIYAASYKTTSESFPLVWDTLNTLGWVHGVNVSQRYIDLYKQSNTKEANENEIMVRVWMLVDKSKGLISDNRFATNVQIYDNARLVDAGTTADTQQDMNDYLYFILSKNKQYTAKYKNSAGKEKQIQFIATDTLLLIYHSRN